MQWLRGILQRLRYDMKNKIKLISSLILLFIAAVFWVNKSDGYLTSSFAERKEGPVKIYNCEVDAGKVTGRVYKDLFGTNLEWFNNANGVFNNNNQIDADLAGLARNQGISVVRFPGGTLSDFYDWKNGTGEQSLRPVSPHYTDPTTSKNCFGSPELIEFCKMIDAKPLITVNAGTGTAVEAAEWVAYMNTEDNERRLKDGFPNPIGVKLWEIGNELYLAGSDAEKEISLTPEEYSRKFLAYSEKMRAVDPSISLMAIGVAGSYSIPFGPHASDWNRIVLSTAGDKIDYISLHNAYFPVLYEKKKYDKKSVYQALWGAVLAVDKDLYEVEDLIAIYCKNNKPGIAVTEWGPFFSITDADWTDHVKTMGSAVYVARIFQTFMQHSGVKIANYFKFTDNTFMGWTSFKKEPKIPYYVVQLYSKYFGSLLTGSNIETPYFETEKTGIAQSQTKVPVLNVVSSINESGNKLFINIVSCSWDKELEIKLVIKNFNSAAIKKGVVRTISGASPLSHNGKDLPEWWPVKAVEPSPRPESIRIKKTYADCSKTIVVPPASIIMIELDQTVSENPI